MEEKLKKSTGISLGLGSLLITLTMILHPVGGNFQHIIQESRNLIFTHSLAVFSVPFLQFGFYGLSKRLADKSKISTFALIIMSFGLVAVMLAALANGVVLPLFLGQFAGNLQQDASTLQVIAHYNFAFNKALDYVFIAACTLTIAMYSAMIVATGSLKKWLGYFGILIIIIAVVGLASGFAFTSLLGFRIFIFSIAGWVFAAAILLFKRK